MEREIKEVKNEKCEKCGRYQKEIKEVKNEKCEKCGRYHTGHYYSNWYEMNDNQCFLNWLKECI